MAIIFTTWAKEGKKLTKENLTGILAQPIKIENGYFRINNFVFNKNKNTVEYNVTLIHNNESVFSWGTFILENPDTRESKNLLKQCYNHLKEILQNNKINYRDV